MSLWGLAHCVRFPALSSIRTCLFGDSWESRIAASAVPLDSFTLPASGHGSTGSRLVLPFFLTRLLVDVDSEAILEPLEQTRVNLADTRLGESGELSNLTHRKFFPILEVDDAVLLLGQSLRYELQ